MRMNLSMFLSVVDGLERIKVRSGYAGTMFVGQKYNCPFFDVEVVGVWTEDNMIVIEVA